MYDSLADVLAECHVEYRQHLEDHHVSSDWLGVLCPRCNSSSFHGGFSLKSGAYSCYNCGSHNPVEVLAELTGLPYRECRLLLRRRDDGDRPECNQPQQGKLVLPKGVGPLLPLHRKYLKSRDFDPDEIASLWGVQGIGLSIRGMSWRLFIPIHDRWGKVVSWTTRLCCDDEGVPRYRSAAKEQEAISAKRVLYGQHLVRGHAVAVVEGPLDAWRIGPGAVATLGVSYSEEQAAVIADYSTRIICFDADDAGQLRANHLGDRLRIWGHKDTWIAKLTTGKDASRCSTEELAELRKALNGETL